MIPTDSEFYRECPEQNKIEKGGGKKFILWRDLVVTVKLTQFLTDRAQSGNNRSRILPGVSLTKNLKKEVKKKFMLWA